MTNQEFEKRLDDAVTQLTSRFTPATAEYKDGTKVDVFTVRAEDIPRFKSALRQLIGEGIGEDEAKPLEMARTNTRKNMFRAELRAVFGIKEGK